MRQTQRHPLQRCLTAFATATVTAFALQTPQGLADSPGHPRLMQAATAQASTDGLGRLHDSLLRLAADPAGTDVGTTAHPQRDALQNALQQLSSPRQKPTAQMPRLGRIDRSSSGVEPQALAAIASSLLAVQHGSPLSTTGPAGTVDDLRRAMGRFPTVTDTLLSDTFSGVLLGLADIGPTLSDSLMTHPSVDKQALRERVVEARLPATGPITPNIQLAQSAPRLSQPSPDPVVAAALLPASDDGLLAELDQPMDTIALGDTMAAPQSGWDTIASPEEELVAMEDTVDLDQIDLDELGAADIASAAVPVATDDLQETRAGFLLDNGVKIDFAVTKMTSIDGLDQLHTITRLPDTLDATALGQISVGRFANTQVLSPNGGSMVTLIQNDLDNQRIVDITTIDIGIQNLGIRSIDLLRPAFQGIDIPAELRR